MERRRVVVLLPDRESGTVETWLSAHPEIAVFARDRGGCYGEAATRALPMATQVADRWHLMENASAAFLNASHSDLEIVLHGFNAAYNSRRQRVLKGLSPEMVLRQRLEAEPAVANPTYEPPNRTIIKRALQVLADAKEVSHPGS